MRLFATVVELKTFTAASQKLNMSRALLSRRIRALEDELGVRLLNRTTRRLNLTEAGVTYYDCCRRIMETALEAEESVRSVKNEPAGLLRVAMPILFGEDVFAPLLGEFRRRYPQIRLHMDLTDQPGDLVASGYDLVIRWGVRQEDSAYISRTISPMPVLTFGAPKYLEAMGKPQHPGELSNHNCLIYSPLRRGREIWYFKDADKILELAVEGDIEANHAKVLVTAALNGLGLLYAPVFFVEQHLKEGRLLKLLDDYPMVANIYALYPHRMIAMKERAFLNFLCEKVPPAVGADFLQLKQS